MGALSSLATSTGSSISQMDFPPGLELIAGAIHTLPQNLANPMDRSQKVSFNVPAACVSAVIGKGGMGVKEISQATETKIGIREIDGNEAEKVVMIQGSVVGVVAAYVHLAGRVATAMEMVGVAPGGLGNDQDLYDPLKTDLGEEYV